MNTKKPTVVLVPGLLCDSVVWAGQIDALQPRFNVVVPDLRDFDSLTTMAKSVLNQIDADFHLVGHSMGARVAFEIVHEAPSRVKSLAVLDTGAHPRAANEAARRQKFLDIAAVEGTRGVAREWIPIMTHPGRHGDEELIDRITRMVSGYTAHQFQGQIKALLNRRDMTPILPTIACPTLVAVGRQDAWAPVHQHEAIAAAIPGAKLVVIEECGHMSTMEKPDEVNALLAEWLATQQAEQNARRL